MKGILLYSNFEMQQENKLAKNLGLGTNYCCIINNSVCQLVLLVTKVLILELKRLLLFTSYLHACFVHKKYIVHFENFNQKKYLEYNK